MPDLQPIILFALPRSGSTLLQRMLAAHPAIATAPEPWVLLPLVYGLQREGVLAEYGHRLAADSIRAFCAGLPGGEDSYRAELRELALRLYRRASPNGATRYFLDKTPRYVLAAQEIMDLFPQGRFVFLFRHPLAVAASNNETFAGGRWYVPNQKAVLYTGLARMVDAWRRNRDRAVSVNFERLVAEPEATLRRLCEHLDLPYDAAMIDRFAEVDLGGGRGDPVGAAAYGGALSAEPLDKWGRAMANPLRRAWCRRYLNWIGAERLETMGYDLPALLAETRAAPANPRYLVSDAWRMTRGVLYCALQGPAVKLGLRKALRGPWSEAHAFY